LGGAAAFVRFVLDWVLLCPVFAYYLELKFTADRTTTVILPSSLS